VKVHHDDFGTLAKPAEQGFPHREGTTDAGHIDTPLEVDNADGNLFLGDQVVSRARNSRGIVLRSQDAIIFLQEGKDLFTLPNVVTGGDNIDSRFEQPFRRLGGDSQSFRSVFTVRNDQIRSCFFEETLQAPKHGPTARLSDNITEYENLDCVDFIYLPSQPLVPVY